MEQHAHGLFASVSSTAQARMRLMGLKGSMVVATLLITVGFVGCSGNATQPSPSSPPSPTSATFTGPSPTACSQVTLNIFPQRNPLTVGAEGGPTKVYFDGVPSGGALSCTQLLPVSNSLFITIGSVGYDNDKIRPAFYAYVVVDPNSEAVSRTGTVSFNDATLIVQQPAAVTP